HVDVDVRLGRVAITHGNQVRAILTGSSKVSTNGETTITGQLTATKGWIDVRGKRFEIERGTISFNGESPPNPVVMVTAGWTAADGTRVYADFVGPTKTGKVDLRSEPPRPKSELLALILFGSADGTTPTTVTPGKQPAGAMKAAVGLGGGLAAQGL